jgi:phage shock protein PspC (stress-responsive transcriptional regulator)
MKKTISVSLGGYIFNIEEDAFEQLNNYLNAIRRQFSAYPDSEEILKDMEARMAEHFQMAGKGGDKVVTALEVNELIKTMGQPQEFGEPGEPRPGAAPEPPTKQKKLMRNPDDKVLAGVAGGAASYLGIDTVWVRLTFVLVVILGGSGILLYVILWIIMPEARTETEKMQMRGEPVTLKQIEQNIKERVSDIKISDTGNRFKNFLSAVFYGIGKIIKAFFWFIRKIAGLGFLIGAAAALIGLTFGLVTILFNQNSPYVDFPIRDFLYGIPFYAALFSAFFVAFIPMIFLLLAGQSLLIGKNFFNRYAGITLLVLWVTSLITGGALATRYAPEIKQKLESHPQYAQATKTLAAKNFSQVDIGDSYYVTITKGPEFSAEATGRQNDLEKIELEAKDGKLTVRKMDDKRICVFCISDEVRITITMPAVDSLFAHGAARVEMKGFNSKNLAIKLSGASRGEIDSSASTTTISLSGASRVQMLGKADSLDLTESGSSRFYGHLYGSKTVKAKLSGASQAHVNASDKIDVTASGASRLYYQGSAEVRESLSGASRVAPEESERPENYGPLQLVEPFME